MGSSRSWNRELVHAAMELRAGGKFSKPFDPIAKVRTFCEHSVNSDLLCRKRSFDYFVVLSVNTSDTLGGGIVWILVDVFRRLEWMAKKPGWFSSCVPHSRCRPTRTRGLTSQLPNESPAPAYAKSPTQPPSELSRPDDRIELPYGKAGIERNT